MRRALAAAVALLAMNASAGTITSLSPSSVLRQSGEYFVRVNGSSLGGQVTFNGPAGIFTLDVNAVDINGNVTAWIPQEIVNNPGTYTVTSGNSNAVNFLVTSPRRFPFRLLLPELLVASARTKGGTGIKYEVLTDGAEGTVSISCEPASGSTFPLGATTVRCSGSDQGGNRDTGEFSVQVSDTTPPVLAVPKPFQVDADSQEGGYVKYEASAVDDIDGTIRPTCLPESGAFFRPGKTVVTCEADDLSLNPSIASFDVLVVPKDYGKLQIDVPADMKVPAQSKEGAIVWYEVRASGSADPDPVVSCFPESETNFPMGDTKVYCTAVDDFGQRAENAFYVSVVDAFGLKMPDVSAEATSASGANVTWEPVEGWQAEIQCSPASGALFALGDTTVDCESKDARGKRATGSFKVSVADTIAPHIDALRAAVGRVDETHDIVPIDITVDAVDAVDAMPRCSVATLTSETNGTAINGRATSDLRVEVAPDSRPFRIQVSCVDAAGNRSTDTLRVAMPGSTRRNVATH